MKKLAAAHRRITYPAILATLKGPGYQGLGKENVV
jgi:hypothetical protein